jgi:hypothetical protein
VKVVDTVGAGDGFMGALIDGLVSHEVVGPGHHDALATLTPSPIEELISRAAAAAAITVSRPGADPPWRAEAGPGLSAPGVRAPSPGLCRRRWGAPGDAEQPLSSASRLVPVSQLAALIDGSITRFSRQLGQTSCLYSYRT